MAVNGGLTSVGFSNPHLPHEDQGLLALERLGDRRDDHRLRGIGFPQEGLDDRVVWLPARIVHRVECGLRLLSQDRAVCHQILLETLDLCFHASPPYHWASSAGTASSISFRCRSLTRARGSSCRSRSTNAFRSSGQRNSCVIRPPCEYFTIARNVMISPFPES